VPFLATTPVATTTVTTASVSQVEEEDEDSDCSRCQRVVEKTPEMGTELSEDAQYEIAKEACKDALSLWHEWYTCKKFAKPAVEIGNGKREGLTAAQICERIEFCDPNTATTTTTTTTEEPIVRRWLNLGELHASQSSTKRPATLATDGNLSTSGDACACTELDDNPWWEVELSGRYAVLAVKVTNRAAFAWRLRGFNVLVDGAVCATNQDIEASETKTVQCDNPNGVVGGKVRIMLPKAEYLTLCEVGIQVGEAESPKNGPLLQRTVLRGSATEVISASSGLSVFGVLALALFALP